MNRVIKMAAAAAALGGLLGASVASADGGEGRYWSGPGGSVWKTGFGACWGFDYAPEGYTPGCDPEPEAMQEEIEVAAVEAPEPAFTSVELSAVTLFDFDSATLRAEGVEAVRQVASRAKNAKRIDRVQVAGFTDNVGADEYNLKLSERRAEAVKRELVRAGIDEDVIRARGYGEKGPVANNSTPEGRQKNRRVELEVLAIQ